VTAKRETVALSQKTVDHTPQRKVLEFFVAILGGSAHLKGLGFAAHLLDKDRAVAQAWGENWKG
jgi:hypothetical protein